MSDKVTTLFDELTQICNQYKAEVPGRRRAWPQSIKKRISELRQLGVGASEIAACTSIPIQTIYSWSNNAKSSSFLPVKVTAIKAKSKTPTVTVRKRSIMKKAQSKSDQIPTVTVVTPSGIRVEGLTAEVVMNWLKGGQV